MKYTSKDKSKQRDNQLLLLDKLAPKSTDYTAFNNTCETFRQVCGQIRVFADLEEFHGGFEEAVAFLQSEAFINDKVTGTYLFSLWQGADKSATYEASKLGIGQPEWWKLCWE